MTSAVPPAVRHVTERDLQTAVVALAERSGWRVAHFHDSRRQIAPGRFIGDRQASGFPDLVAVRGGTLLFAELKSATGRLKPTQQSWLEELAVVAERAPTVVGVRVWTPRSWADVEGTLERRWP